MGDDMKLNRDTGVIGEKKTTHGRRESYDQKTGITYVRHKSSFVTPVVVGDTAYFDLDVYKFNFSCLGWPYSLQAYWSGVNGASGWDVNANRAGFFVRLESPDENTIIETIEVDIPVDAPLLTTATPEQAQALHHQTYTEDPFLGEERFVAAQQAITWVLKQGLLKYQAITDTPLRFMVEPIGEHTFVKTEVEVIDQKAQVTKKCVLWALNLRGYRLQGAEDIRKMETWICSIIGDAPDHASLAAKARMVLETLTFNRLISEGMRQQQAAEFERWH